MRSLSISTLKKNIMLVETFQLASIEALGVQEEGFMIAAYDDFIAHGIAPEYDGVLGLDFLRRRKFCIDVEAGIMTIKKP